MALKNKSQKKTTTTTFNLNEITYSIDNEKKKNAVTKYY